jgi:ankyrin repeat protein
MPQEKGPATEDDIRDFLNAVSRGDLPAVAAVLEAHPEAVHLRRDSDRTLLSYLCHMPVSGNDSPALRAMAALLLDKGVEINAKDVHGITAFFYAAWGQRHELAELLLEKGADPDSRNARNETPLMYSGDSRGAEMIRRLLGAGADVNAQDKEGWTPLMWAIRGGYTDGVKALLEQGAKINLAANNGTTPLALAAGWGKDDLAQMLIDAGADADAANDEGETPRDIALRQSHYEKHREIADIVLKGQVRNIGDAVMKGTSADIKARPLRLKAKGRVPGR